MASSRTEDGLVDVPKRQLAFFGCDRRLGLDRTIPHVSFLTVLCLRLLGLRDLLLTLRRESGLSAIDFYGQLQYIHSRIFRCLHD